MCEAFGIAAAPGQRAEETALCDVVVVVVEIGANDVASMVFLRFCMILYDFV